MDTVEEAYERYGRRMYGFALSLLTSPQDAEDVVQEVFATLAGMGARLAQVRQPAAYLYRATRNAAARLRQRRRETPGLDPELLLVEAPQGRREQALDLSRALATLPVLQREAVVLKLHHGLTFDQIGAVTGVSGNTAASRYRYGLERMRSALGSRPPRGGQP